MASAAVTSAKGASTAVRSTYAAEAPRTDIQALRALAVSLVLVYHLFPHTVTGGYVGVDVFFVISGFLITAHLIGKPPRNAHEVASFWARRVRRLLPAALLVLGATLLASWLVAPATMWGNTARQVIAASSYVENWVLASSSVDYLAADNAPTPVQHFWSLSVEEQFYFVWPVLVAILIVLAARSGRRWLLAAGLAVVAVASLAYSILATAASPASAYFVTPARAWEFALGGLLAVLIRALTRTDAEWLALIPRPARVLLTAAGLAAVIVAAVTFDARTPFPGWHALLPTLGTVAAIVGSLTVADGALGRLMARRGVQFMGDVSYSVYLWHWPLIVLVPFVSGDSLGLLGKGAILVLAIGLATVTKTAVEDPCRLNPRLRSLRRTYGAAAAAMAVVVGLASAQLVVLHRQADAAQNRLEQAVGGADDCFGAGSLRTPDQCADHRATDVVPAPAQAETDKSDAYADVSGGADCWSNSPSYPLVRCSFGDPRGVIKIALVGNSHAGQWLPTLQVIAKQQHLRIDTFLASQCAASDTPQAMSAPGASRQCSRWVADVSRRVADGGYAIVVLANRLSVTAQGVSTIEASVPSYQRGYEALLGAWSAAGVRVLGIRDTPAPGDAGISSVPDCVAQHGDELFACSGARHDWVPPDPLPTAIERVSSNRAIGVDLNDQICGPEHCDAVVGGVLVYFDGSHLTATYARTLAPPVAAAVSRALRGG